MAISKNTSFLIFNKNIIKGNIQKFRDVLSSNCYLLFSIKSFPHQDLINWLAPYIQGFDISNEHEACLISKWNQKIISAVSPCLKIALIEKEIDKRVDYIYVDESTIVQCPSKSDILIRVKVTDFIADISTNMPSRFGMSKATIREVTIALAF